MYADNITRSMKLAIDETNRRRKIQDEYNRANGITPQTIKKDIRDLISIEADSDEISLPGKKGRKADKKDPESMTKKELEDEIKQLTKRMNKAATELNFELAAELRDEIKRLKIMLRDYDK
jgi:excinuclease ABC subunit B